MEAMLHLQALRFTPERFALSEKIWRNNLCEDELYLSPQIIVATLHFTHPLPNLLTHILNM